MIQQIHIDTTNTHKSTTNTHKIQQIHIRYNKYTEDTKIHLRYNKYT